MNEFFSSVTAGIVANLTFVVLVAAFALRSNNFFQLRRSLNIPLVQPFGSTPEITVHLSRDGTDQRPMCSPSEVRAVRTIAETMRRIGIRTRLDFSGSVPPDAEMVISLGGPGLNIMSSVLVNLAKQRNLDIELNPVWGDKFLDIGGVRYQQQSDTIGQTTADYGVIVAIGNWRGIAGSGECGLLLAGVGGLGTEATAAALSNHDCVTHLYRNTRKNQNAWLVVRAAGDGYRLASVDLVASGSFSSPNRRKARRNG